MATVKRQSIVNKVMRQFQLQSPPHGKFQVDAVDLEGRAYHIKYRTEGKLSSLSFDFRPDELAAEYDFFIGVVVNEKGELSDAIRVRRSDIKDLGNENLDSLRVRWNERTLSDHRVSRLEV